MYLLLELCEAFISAAFSEAGNDDGMMDWKWTGNPYPHRRDSSGEGGKFMFLGVHITDKLKWSTNTDSAAAPSSTSGG